LSFVLASIASGAYLTVTTEVLSLLRGLTVPGLVVTWLFPVLVLAVLLRRSRIAAVAMADLRTGWARCSRLEKVLLAGLVLICGVLLGIAFASLPSNVDSALYHMARVMHWAQNASLRPYPTIMEHQLHKPIWAESAILHLRVLWGNDQPANLTQWFSMIGSMVVASGIAALLGGKRGAQLLAATYAVSIPMGILQSTSTQNDYVAAFWAVCLAYLVVLGVRRRLTSWETAALAAAVGLSVLTKGTGFVYAPPFVAWFLLHELLRRGIRRAAVAGLAVAAISVVLNAGFWGRNIAVYGGPYGTSEWIQRNLWVRFFDEAAPLPLENPGVAATADAAGEAVATASPAATPVAPVEPVGQPLAPFSPLARYAVRLAQTAGRNLTLPTGFLSRPVTAALASAAGVFGEEYANELRAVSWNDENYAGNPIHLFLVPVSLVLLLVSWKRPEVRLALGYAGVTLLTYAMIPVVIGHGPSIFGIRYQLSYFVLWAPITGYAFGLFLGERTIRIFAAILLLTALPWVLMNKSRPLIGSPPVRTVIGSIVAEDEVTRLMPWTPRLRDDYVGAARAVRESACRDVGLRADSDFLEYPLWWLLGAPQSGVRLESLETTPSLERFADPAFAPCAIICANCGEDAVSRGLPLFGTYDTLSVYMDR
jgi:hypothetical protein